MRKTMKRIIVAFLALLITAPAFGESASNVPPKFQIPWGNSAGGAYIRSIPQGSQIGIQNCAASLTDGFPPLTFVAQGSGGCPPFGQDFNGILKQLSQWNRWMGAGAFTTEDPTFQSAIGGYPMGSMLLSAIPGCYFFNTADNNTVNPTVALSNWTFTCMGTANLVGTTASTGSPNAQAITTVQSGSGAPAIIGTRITFVAGFANSGPMTLNVNSAGAFPVLRPIFNGLSALQGGEVSPNKFTTVTWDGTNYELEVPATIATLSNTDQNLTGGANVTSLINPQGNITVDCGLSPLQDIGNAAPFAITAPANDGSCMLMIENGPTAGAITAGAAQGWTIGANTGDPFDTGSGHRFVMSIWRINGGAGHIASYIIKALQ
jgi:hypothetical protein